MSRHFLLPAILLVAACAPDNGSESAPDAASDAPDIATAEQSASPDAAARRGPAEVENIEASTDAYSYETVFDDGLSQYPGLYEHVRAMSEEAMQAMASTASDDYANWQSGEQAWEWRPYDIGWTWEIVWSDETRVSVLQSWYEYTGGAHPNHGTGSALWLVPEQRTIGLPDLFTDGSEGSPVMLVLLDAIRADLIDQKQRRLGDVYNAEQDEMWLGDLAPRADSFGAFTLAPSSEGERAGGLIFHFDPYAVGAYAEGDYRVLVPQSVFREYLTAEWQGVFAGTPDVNPEDLQP